MHLISFAPNCVVKERPIERDRERERNKREEVLNDEGSLSLCPLSLSLSQMLHVSPCLLNSNLSMLYWHDNTCEGCYERYLIMSYIN